MRPLILRALLGVALSAALIDIAASYAHADEPAPPAAVAVDAGPQNGVGSSPLTVSAPAPHVTVPDAVEHPAEAVSAVTDTYKHNGIWAAVLMVAFILFTAAGKRTGPGTLLGNGRWASGIAGALATSGSALDWQLGHATWAVPVTTLAIAIAAFISPHVVHSDEKPVFGGSNGGIDP